MIADEGVEGHAGGVCFVEDAELAARGELAEELILSCDLGGSPGPLRLTPSQAAPGCPRMGAPPSGRGTASSSLAHVSRRLERGVRATWATSTCFGASNPMRRERAVAREARYWTGVVGSAMVDDSLADSWSFVREGEERERVFDSTFLTHACSYALAVPLEMPRSAVARRRLFPSRRREQ